MSYLRRTPISFGHQRTWTFAGWYYKSRNGTAQNLISPRYGGDGSNEAQLGFQNTDQFRYYDSGGGSGYPLYSTTAKYRDVGWYHIIVAVDTTLEKNVDRVKIYINGHEITDWASSQVPDQNQKMGMGRYFTDIGKAAYTNNYYAEGSVFDFYFVDGHALTPDIFGYHKDGKGYMVHGSQDTTSAAVEYIAPGQWAPKSSIVVKREIERRGGFNAIGNNGFYLPFNGSADPGYDFHCTPNTIIKLKGEDNPQPECGAPTTSDNYVSQLRSDPFSANLVLAAPLITGGLDSGAGDYHASIKGSGTNKTGAEQGGGGIKSVRGSYGSAYYGDGSSDAILYTKNSDYDFGNGDFCVECWAYRVTGGSSNTIMGVFNHGANRRSWQIEGRSNNAVRFEWSYNGTSNNDITTGADKFPLNQWNHVALVRKGSRMMGFINGMNVGSANVSSSTLYNATGSDDLAVGAMDPNCNQSWRGYISDVRIYKGVSKYSGGFEVGAHYNGLYLPTIMEGYDFSANVSGWTGDSGAVISWDSGGYMAVDNGPDNTFAAARIGILKPGNLYRIRGMVKPSVSGSYQFRVRAGGSSTQWNMTSGLTNDQWTQFDTGVITADGANLEIGSLGGGITYLYFDWITIEDYTSAGVQKVSGHTTSNTFATLTPQLASVGGTSNVLRGSGLWIDTGSGGWIGQAGTIGVSSGKWYWEGHVRQMSTAGGYSYVFGWTTNYVSRARHSSDNQYWGTDGGDYMVAGHQNGNWVLVNENDFTPTIATGKTAESTIMLALDADARKIWYGVNGTWYNSGNPASGTNPSHTITETIANTSRGEILPVVSTYSNGWDLYVNFGQDPTFNGSTSNANNTYYSDTNGIGSFKYQPPSGFKAICTDNLPDLEIDDPGKYFKSITYAGNDEVTQPIKHVGFQPDLVWIKRRNGTNSWTCGTSIRASGHFTAINGNGGEANEEDKFRCFTEKGFDVGNHNSNGDGSSTYQAYAWKAGGNSNVFNYDGTGYATAAAMNSATGIDLSTNGPGTIAITSCSINSTSKFGCYTWGGTGASGDLAHGLGRAPEFIIIKKISASGNSWAAYIDTLGNQQQMLLNAQNGRSADANGFDALPTSTVINVGSGSAMATNQTGTNMSWVWAPVEGYSKFGGYKGNNNSNGTFVYTGFRPAWVLVKRRDNNQDWTIFTSSVDPYNTMTQYMHPSSDQGEGNYSNFTMDFHANGFRPTGTLNHINANEFYLFAAFAEAPFRYANAK